MGVVHGFREIFSIRYRFCIRYAQTVIITRRGIGSASAARACIVKTGMEVFMTLKTAQNTNATNSVKSALNRKKLKTVHMGYSQFKRVFKKKKTVITF